MWEEVNAHHCVIHPKSVAVMSTRLSGLLPFPHRFLHKLVVSPGGERSVYSCPRADSKRVSVAVGVVQPQERFLIICMKAINASNLQKFLKAILASEESFVVVKYGKPIKMIVPFSGDGMALEFIDLGATDVTQVLDTLTQTEAPVIETIESPEGAVVEVAQMYDVDAERSKIVKQIMDEKAYAEEHRFDKKPRKIHTDEPTNLL